MAKSKWTTKRWTVLGIVLATIIGLAMVIIAVIPLIPSTKLQVTCLTGGKVVPIYNADNSTIIGLNVTFPSDISNIGNTPIHIAACDVFIEENGQPVNYSQAQEPLGEVYYLKPQDSFTYNFTKYFVVSIPTANMTEEDAVRLGTDYYLLIMYYSNAQNYQSYWVNYSQYGNEILGT